MRLPNFNVEIYKTLGESLIMKKHTIAVRGLTGALSVSALALGLSSGAQAASTLVDTTSLTLYSSDGKTSIGSPGSLTLPANSTVIYNPSNGGNNTSGITGMGGAAGPFAPSASVNITYSRHNLGSGNKIGSNHTIAVLASNSSTGDNAVVGTNQICVFCHTPHGFNTVASGPLWNKQVNSSSAYTVYNAGSNNSSTLDADAPVIGSVSLACLSCHDGTQAMDNMINAPGSGGMAQSYDATLTGTSTVGGGNSSGALYSSASGIVTTNAGVSQGYIWGNEVGGFAFMSQGGSGLAGVNGDSPASEGIDLGTDLSNDHPISVQYCGGGIPTNVTGASGASLSGTAISYGGAAAKVADGTCNDRLFNLPTVAIMGGQARFWIDTNIIPDQDAIDAHAANTGGQGANPITRDPDTLEVYVTDGTAAATTNPLSYAGLGSTSAVRAGSCGTGTNGDACGRGFVSYVSNGGQSGIDAGGVSQRIAGWGVRTKQDLTLYTNNPGVVNSPSVECASCHDPHTPNNGTFLRVSNNQSGLCLSCHVK